MKMARVILFTGQIDAMSKFHGEVLGLKQIVNEKGWREFDAGGARIALHSGPSSPGRKGPKIACHAEDVASGTGDTRGSGCEVREGPAGGNILPVRRQGPGRQSYSVVRSLKLWQASESCFTMSLP